MKAHLNLELQLHELEFNGKTYQVAKSINVMNKILNLDDKTDTTAFVTKILLWLVNDAIERENYGKPAEEREKAYNEEYFNLFGQIGNINEYKSFLKEVVGMEFDKEPETDEDGNETVVTDEMIEEFGEIPEEKN